MLFDWRGTLNGCMNASDGSLTRSVWLMSKGARVLKPSVAVVHSGVHPTVWCMTHHAV
jgi:hypothetical protein